MKKNKYDITGLALKYYPESTEKNARRRFIKSLKGERDLWKKLGTMNFSKFQRVLTPKQYEMIIEAFGQPDTDNLDYDGWSGSWKRV